MILLLVDFSDALRFATLLIFTLIVSVGLIVSGLTLRKHGLNPWCGWSTLVFFFALLLASIVISLGARDGVGSDVVLYTLLGCAGLHVLSAVMAMYGVSQVRRRRKWSHGRRRGIWMFWLNLCALFLIGFWSATHVFDLLKRVFNP
jgi:hypothetical protein